MGELCESGTILDQGLWSCVKKLLGKWHPHYVMSMGNLVMLYDRKGDYDKAEPLHVKAVEMQKKRLGDGHPQYVGRRNPPGGVFIAPRAIIPKPSRCTSN